MEPMSAMLEVPLASFADLAVEYWRLQQWLASGSHQGLVVGRHVARRIGRLLAEQDIEVVDLTGQPYEAGLALEVIDAVAADAAGADTSVIVETIAPIVLWKGLVVRPGQVVTGRRASADGNREEGADQ